MIVSTRRDQRAQAVAACLFAAAVSGCAASAARERSVDAAPLRVLVKLVQPSEDPAAIAAEATRIAGVLVSHAAATSASWHALAVHCTNDAECHAAVARLRAAGTLYQAVELDGRKARTAS
jgi:hypothetical protein